MADRRPEDQEMSKAKRFKSTADPKDNPYLAHHYEDLNGGNNGYTNGYSSNNGNGNSSASPAPLSHFKRHQTTAAQAHTVEDGPLNPFNSEPLSEQYFRILRTRRDLPVHKQR